VGRGRTIFCPDEQGSFLKALRTAPADMRFEYPSEHVSFVHRRAADRDFYFIANTSELTQMLAATFRVGHKAPELWDLKSGDVQPVVVFEHTAGGTRVPFTLGPLESKVIVFSGDARRPVAVRSDLALEPDGARVFENGVYSVEAAAGRRRVAVSGIPAPFLPAIRWKLTLGEQRHELEDLRSWTELEKSRFFSGRGVYEGEFEAPNLNGFGAVLDLGTVRETADVHLNGTPAGVAWMRPYRVDVTRLLRRGRNTVRIDVTNLLINQVLGQGPIDYSAVFAKYGHRFPAGDELEVVRDPLPSGLLGPVRLVYYKLVRS